MTAPRALVAHGLGLHCAPETLRALRLAGVDALPIHAAQLLRDAGPLQEAQLLVLPGGFSYGDALGAGRMLATQLRHAHLASGRRFLDALVRYLGDGKSLLGICNGFQALVKAGLLPFGVGTGGLEQVVTLTHNDSGRFEDRWVRVAAQHGTPASWLTGATPMELPVRHGEGKLVCLNDAVRARLVEQRLVALWYCDEDDRPTGRYPENPNGAELAAAALCDPSGQVVGLMPHPEVAVEPHHHPDWSRRQSPSPDNAHGADGLVLLRRLAANLVAPLVQRRGVAPAP